MMKKSPFIFSPVGASLCCLATLFSGLSVSANLAPISAQIELCTGDVQISKSNQQAPIGGALMPGDTLQTADNDNSRCRITFSNGNAIHIASGTTVKFESGQTFTIVRGQVLAYAMPMLEQQAQAINIHIGNGKLALTMGKAYISALNEKPYSALFNDLVAATWQDQNGEKTLYPGNLIYLSAQPIQITSAPSALEASVSEQTSPEQPAVNQATQAFNRRDLVTANRLFKQIQQAFPYNAAAAYYLGLFALNDQHVAEAVKQWQKYVEIDPEGAQKNGVTKQLTLMTTKSIQDEVRQAIAKENTLSKLPPEPNSIAVNPLVNKGAKQYQPIGKGLTAFIITDIAKVPGLKVLEREKLQTLIDEIKLSAKGGLVEESTRIRADHILRAEKLMIGDYLIESGKGQP